MNSEHKYLIEEIPNTDFLYQRVHKNHNINGILALGLVFKNHGAGMSTDWSKYSTPELTKKRAAYYYKNPENYGVINMKVEDVRSIESQVVKHTPINENQSHTDVIGKKSPKEQVLFNRIYSWSIKP
ncbi:MAG: hypothetical protein NT175_08685 [Bacteroidetes bacterium]|nr:hypothetical protein [Bacteroidota bacterium]